jgi:hypothetical protein
MLIDLRLIQKDFASGASKQRLSEAKLLKKKQFYLYGGGAALLALLIGIGFYSRR